MSYVVLLGRVLFSSLFLYNGVMHFVEYDRTVAFAMQQGLILPGLATSLSGLAMLAGGAMILANRSTRHGALLLAPVLFSTALFVHDFWNETSLQAVQAEFHACLWHLALCGACLLLAGLPDSVLRCRRQPPSAPLTVGMIQSAERTVPRV